MCWFTVGSAADDSGWFSKPLRTTTVVGGRDGKPGLGDERVARGRLAIEHVMPRKWVAHWPLDGHPEPE